MKTNRLTADDYAKIKKDIEENKKLREEYSKMTDEEKKAIDEEDEKFIQNLKMKRNQRKSQVLT